MSDYDYFFCFLFLDEEFPQSQPVSDMEEDEEDSRGEEESEDGEQEQEKAVVKERSCNCGYLTGPMPVKKTSPAGVKPAVKKRKYVKKTKVDCKKNFKPAVNNAHLLISAAAEILKQFQG